MLVKELKSTKQISSFLESIAFGQYNYEQGLEQKERKKNGVFLTSSLLTVENLLDVIIIDYDIFSKRILEPSCGQGIFVLKLLADVYLKFPDSLLISNFISNNIFFVDVQEEMIEKTKSNIRKLYTFLFEEDFKGSFNGITWDFTDKIISGNSLFEEIRTTHFQNYTIPLIMLLAILLM